MIDDLKTIMIGGWVHKGGPRKLRPGRSYVIGRPEYPGDTRQARRKWERSKKPTGHTNLTAAFDGC